MIKLIFCILKVTEDFGTDPHPHLDPYQNVTDPEHCFFPIAINRFISIMPFLCHLMNQRTFLSLSLSFKSLLCTFFIFRGLFVPFTLVSSFNKNFFNTICHYVRYLHNCSGVHCSFF
jgi:hypothetical protein